MLLRLDVEDVLVVLTLGVLLLLRVAIEDVDEEAEEDDDSGFWSTEPTVEGDRRALTPLDEWAVGDTRWDEAVGLEFLADDDVIEMGGISIGLCIDVTETAGLFR